MGLSAAYGFLQTDKGYVGLSSYERKMITKVDTFAAPGTWTVPSGVTYAIAHIRGGGGGVGAAASGAGGNSSVAFAGGTITANGGNLCNATTPNNNVFSAVAGVANSGQGGFGSVSRVAETTAVWRGGDGAYIVAGGTVTPGVGITVTVGAGGTAGTGGAAGGSGYVWIEYQVAL